MSHYKSNVRDIAFTLFDVLGTDAMLGRGLAEDIDRETAEAMLAEVDQLARTKLADSFVEGDRHPPIYDPATKTVRLPEAVKMAYKAYQDSDWWRVELPSAIGGQDCPPSLRWGLVEMILGANPSVYLYSAGPKFSQAIYECGTERDKDIAKIIVDRQWGATMVLTEPDAGSDVGAGRTKAHRQPDGTWHIEGVKRFITSGEHDLTENIIHLVLARPESAQEAGTKGLSMFIVPKYNFDPETGELTGRRNGVFATNVEHKMGLKVSTTCEMTFGADEPAVGWLLGEEHDGIAQMFRIIEYARMMVGTKAIATLSTGYLNALDYAKQRVQGGDLVEAGNRSAPRVTITHHADVRRSLMTQKAYVEGMRALVLYTASIQDRIWRAGGEGSRDAEAESVNDLLLPIVKGYGSERSWTLLGSESLQIFGGSGYLADYPLEQYVRDAKIDTLYEGTTAIQGQDLFFRKIVKDKSRALDFLTKEIQAWINSGGGLENERALLSRALADVTAMVAAMGADLKSSGPDGDSRNIYKVGLNTSRLLLSLGDLLCGWLLLRGAEAADLALEGSPKVADADFYRGKIAAAQWFAQTVLPKLTAELAIAEATNLDVMDLDEASF